jgi:hypothetical protein
VRTKLSAGGLVERFSNGKGGTTCCRGKLQSEESVGNPAGFRIGLLNKQQPLESPSNFLESMRSSAA